LWWFVILSAIAFWGLTEKWFVLLWLVMLSALLFGVWQRSDLYWCGWLYCLPLLRSDRGVFFFYCLWIYILLTITDWDAIGKWFVLLCEVILSTIIVWSLTEEWFVLLYLTIRSLLKVNRKWASFRQQTCLFWKNKTQINSLPAIWEKVLWIDSRNLKYIHFKEVISNITLHTIVQIQCNVH
jgi:hypothetical protein